MLSDTPDATLDYLPPRWTWFRRIAIAFGCGLVLMLALRLYAGHALARELAELEQRFRASGVAWDVTDLNPTRIAPGEANAAELYLQAVAARTPGVETYRNSVYDIQINERYADLFYWLALQAEQKNQKTLQLAHAARDVEPVDWGNPLSNTNVGSAIFSGWYTQARTLANELADTGLYSHFTGDDLTAIDRGLDGLRLARAVVSDRRLIGSLVGTGITLLTLDFIEQTAHEIRVEDPAVRQAVLGLMAELETHERAIEVPYADAVVGDTAFVRWWIDDALGNAWLSKPTAVRAMIRVSNEAFAVGEAMRGVPVASQPNQIEQAGTGAKLVRLFGEQWTITPPLHPDHYFAQSGSMYDRFPQVCRRIHVELRLARTLLALRLYYVDHHQRWPASVDDLVPTYLPAVPLSPFSPSKYRVEFQVLPKARPDGADRPMVYVDLLNSNNQPTDRLMTAWQAASGGAATSTPADQDGRQWRDAAGWPESLYPRVKQLAERESQPFWMEWDNPGNPAALQAPPKHPEEPDEPRNDAEPESGVERP
jgi:hypothetical protein